MLFPEQREALRVHRMPQTVLTVERLERPLDVAQ